MAPDWLASVIIHPLTRSELPALEWGGEFTHFRNLFAAAYRRARLGAAVLWVAVRPSGEMLGQVFVQLSSQRTDLADGKARAYLHSFRVRVAYRNAGLGSRLLATAENDLLARGFWRATLNVERSNHAAQRFYLHHGYHVVAPEDGQWSYRDHNNCYRVVDELAWRMEKELHVPEILVFPQGVARDGRR